MTDVIGVIVGLIGGGLFYKFVSSRFIYFTHGIKSSFIVPISIYLVGFLLTTIIFAPIISAIGGTITILLWLIKIVIKFGFIFIVAYIVYILLKNIVCIFRK